MGPYLGARGVPHCHVVVVEDLVDAGVGGDDHDDAAAGVGVHLDGVRCRCSSSCSC